MSRQATQRPEATPRSPSTGKAAIGGLGPIYSYSADSPRHPARTPTIVRETATARAASGTPPHYLDLNSSSTQRGARYQGVPSSQKRALAPGAALFHSPPSTLASPPPPQPTHNGSYGGEEPSPLTPRPLDPARSLSYSPFIPPEQAARQRQRQRQRQDGMGASPMPRQQQQEEPPRQGLRERPDGLALSSSPTIAAAAVASSLKSSPIVPSREGYAAGRTHPRGDGSRRQVSDSRNDANTSIPIRQDSDTPHHRVGGVRVVAYPYAGSTYFKRLTECGGAAEWMPEQQAKRRADIAAIVYRQGGLLARRESEAREAASETEATDRLNMCSTKGGCAALSGPLTSSPSWRPGEQAGPMQSLSSPLSASATSSASYRRCEDTAGAGSGGRAVRSFLADITPKEKEEYDERVPQPWTARQGEVVAQTVRDRPASCQLTLADSLSSPPPAKNGLRSVPKREGTPPAGRAGRTRPQPLSQVPPPPSSHTGPLPSLSISSPSSFSGECGRGEGSAQTREAQRTEGDDGSSSRQSPIAGRTSIPGEQRGESGDPAGGSDVQAGEEGEEDPLWAAESTETDASVPRRRVHRLSSSSHGDVPASEEREGEEDADGSKADGQNRAGPPSLHGAILKRLVEEEEDCRYLLTGECPPAAVFSRWAKRFLRSRDTDDGEFGEEESGSAFLVAAADHGRGEGTPYGVTSPLFRRHSVQCPPLHHPSEYQRRGSASVTRATAHGPLQVESTGERSPSSSATSTSAWQRRIEARTRHQQHSRSEGWSPLDPLRDGASSRSPSYRAPCSPEGDLFGGEESSGNAPPSAAPTLYSCSDEEGGAFTATAAPTSPRPAASGHAGEVRQEEEGSAEALLQSGVYFIVPEPCSRPSTTVTVTANGPLQEGGDRDGVLTDILHDDWVGGVSTSASRRASASLRAARLQDVEAPTPDNYISPANSEREERMNLYDVFGQGLVLLAERESR